jgi:hypothetical protein
MKINARFWRSAERRSLGPSPRAQQLALPVVAFINAGSADGSAAHAAAFRKCLGEADCVEGQNVTVEYHWLEGQISSSRRLYRQNPQRRETRRPAGAAAQQIRVRYQPANGARARHRGAAGREYDRLPVLVANLVRRRVA